MAPRQHITEKRGRYDKEEKYHPGNSSLYIYITAVVEAPAHVSVQADKKETGPIGVHPPQEPTPIHVPENVPHRGEGQGYVGCIVHSKKEAC